MAAKKKAKTKAKKKTKKVPTRRVVGYKKAAPKQKTKPKVKKKAKPKAAPKAGVKKKAKAKAAPKTKRVAIPAPAVPTVPPGMARIGFVTHYFPHVSAAIVQLETGSLRVGDVIHIKGHTSDFTQRVESMEIDHVHVNEARPGQSFGVRVKEHAREHDVVYKAKPYLSPLPFREKEKTI